MTAENDLVRLEHLDHAAFWAAIRADPLYGRLYAKQPEQPAVKLAVPRDPAPKLTREGEAALEAKRRAALKQIDGRKA